MYPTQHPHRPPWPSNISVSLSAPLSDHNHHSSQFLSAHLLSLPLSLQNKIGHLIPHHFNPKFIEFPPNCHREQMGLQILEEFRPITPIRTIVPTSRTFKHDLVETTTTTKELLNNDVEECHTPTSPSQKLRIPLVCPPAPKKPRVAKRNNFDPSSQGFFQVPHDLASVFVLRTPNLPKRSTKQALF